MTFVSGRVPQRMVRALLSAGVDPDVVGERAKLPWDTVIYLACDDDPHVRWYQARSLARAYDVLKRRKPRKPLEWVERRHWPQPVDWLHIARDEEADALDRMHKRIKEKEEWLAGLQLTLNRGGWPLVEPR